MVRVGEYCEELKNKKNNQFKLNKDYDSIIRYYKDLISGKLLGIVPYNVIVSPRIISCLYINKEGIEILHIASIKTKTYDRESEFQ